MQSLTPSPCSLRMYGTYEIKLVNERDTSWVTEPDFQNETQASDEFISISRSMSCMRSKIHSVNVRTDCPRVSLVWYDFDMPQPYQLTLWCWGVFNKIDFKFVWTLPIFRPFWKLVLMWRVHMINFEPCSIIKHGMKNLCPCHHFEHNVRAYEMKGPLKPKLNEIINELCAIVNLYAFQWCVFKWAGITWMRNEIK